MTIGSYEEKENSEQYRKDNVNSFKVTKSLLNHKDMYKYTGEIVSWKKKSSSDYITQHRSEI